MNIEFKSTNETFTEDLWKVCVENNIIIPCDGEEPTSRGLQDYLYDDVIVEEPVYIKVLIDTPEESLINEYSREGFYRDPMINLSIVDTVTSDEYVL